MWRDKQGKKRENENDTDFFLTWGAWKKENENKKLQQNHYQKEGNKNERRDRSDNRTPKRRKLNSPKQNESNENKSPKNINKKESLNILPGEANRKNIPKIPRKSNFQESQVSNKRQNPPISLQKRSKENKKKIPRTTLQLNENAQIVSNLKKNVEGITKEETQREITRMGHILPKLIKSKNVKMRGNLQKIVSKLNIINP